ncbi:sulfite exporter TauE/SafE family protein [Rhizorhabdus dicambivorans]|uniref:Probable membrane transporter protein n=1 Tax=Rhizorhabdus dicambivorans TaxID=1850238 RepID=A0A2A4FZQ7_9SPHN|nr:sulfite exporter TauE/SafE family protein [Rhizorhabdus dicambivorans]PCE43696.1 sulfite exporter TauE/SafE family protein [Rhizorhabdus dicambivorans]
MPDPPVLHDPWFWLLGLLAVTLIGLAKGGFSGIGMLGMPLMALAVSPVQAAAILLPLLVVQDAVGIWAFRRSWDRHVMRVMLSGAVFGVLLGYLFAASLREDWMLLALGAITVIFASHQLWIARGGRTVPSRKLPDAVGLVCGVGAGLTSQIAHAGAPPFQIWVYPQRLPRDVLVGTSAIFFGAVNCLKVPAYIGLGQFTAANLTVSAALMPVAILSTFAGVRLVRRVSPDRFYALIYWLTLMVGLKLLWDAVGLLIL